MLEVWKRRARDTRGFSQAAARSGNLMLLCALINLWMSEYKWAFFTLVVGGLNWVMSGLFGRMADKADAKVKEIEDRDVV